MNTEQRPRPLEVAQQEDLARESRESEEPPSLETTFTRQQHRDQIDTHPGAFTPPVAPRYRCFSLHNPSQWTWTPLQLFLAVFQPILDLLVLHTNIAARRKIHNFTTITPLEMRLWIACRLEMTFKISEKASIRNFWDGNAFAANHLSRTRYEAIERYLCLETRPNPSKVDNLWNWLVKDALDILRVRLYELYIPSSHIAVDESTIKFHGRKQDLFLARHKPQKMGFVFLCLASSGGLMHDVLVYSSWDGVEGCQGGLTIDLATRNTRKRKRSTTSPTADQVELSMLKSAVYVLCKRLFRRFNTEQFICFTDNLFTDPHLARALLSLHVGICGTVRGQAPGIPSILKAIQQIKKPTLNDNEYCQYIVDNQALILVWRDGQRKHTVTFLSTSYPLDGLRLVKRATAKLPRTDVEIHRNRYRRPQILTPVIAAEYNNHMGEVDNNNHLRATRTVRRPHQRKWTKKIIEYIIDIAHTNGFIIWRENKKRRGVKQLRRDLFVRSLIQGLVEGLDIVHKAGQQAKGSLCAYSECKTNRHQKRKPLGEVSGNARALQPSRTTDYCHTCSRFYCISKGCFKSFHEAKGLQIRLGGGQQERGG